MTLLGSFYTIPMVTGRRSMSVRCVYGGRSHFSTQ